MEILHNIYTIIAAGTDTTANAVSYTCLQLAMHPVQQQRLYEEIIEVFPDPEPIITLEALKCLPYLEMVLKECLRLYPAAWIVMRENVADITINGLRIPKGNKFAVNIHSMQRRTDVWGANANTFDPERFSPEQKGSRHRFAFLPFSGGRRDCLGAKLAKFSLIDGRILTGVFDFCRDTLCNDQHEDNDGLFYEALPLHNCDARGGYSFSV